MDTSLLTQSFVVPGSAEDLFSKVLRQAVTVPVSLDKRWLAGNISAIDREILALKKFMRKGNHFPVEKVQITAPKAIIKLLETRKHFEMALAGYPLRLEPAFLSSMRKDKFPEFITMTWDYKGDFRLFVRPGNGGSVGDQYFTEPYLHDQLALQYYPAAKHLFAVAKEKGLSELSISAHFAGTIPENTRKLMRQAAVSGLFKVEDCAITAEAPKEWKLQQTVRVEVEKYLDPIVYGPVTVNEGIPDQFYVIDVFDLTAVERAAMEQFSLNPHR